MGTPNIVFKASISHSCSLQAVAQASVYLQLEASQSVTRWKGSTGNDPIDGCFQVATRSQRLEVYFQFLSRQRMLVAAMQSRQGVPIWQLDIRFNQWDARSTLYSCNTSWLSVPVQV